MYKLLALLLALVLAACGQATPPQVVDITPTAQTERSAARQQADIEAAIGGLPLQYLSESESPWVYNRVPKPSFAAWLASWEAQGIEQRRSFQKFFKQLENPLYTNIDAERYRVLEQVLRRHLNHLTIYWIIDPANPAEVQVVILGRNRFGVFALSAISVET